ncbi:MAG: glycerophosphoryl diester phosphodiesterase membrane domain-containing protein [Candidatus Angelobacter sp.]
MDLALRPMSTSQVLDRTFYLYRSNFVLFAGIAIITPALKLIAMLIQLRIFGPMVMPQQPENLTPQFLQALMVRVVISVVVGSIIYIVGTALASSATAFAVSMVHLGKATTIVESYSKVKQIFWRILGLLCTTMFFTLGPLMLSYTLFLGLALGMAFFVRSRGPQTAYLALVLVGGLLGLALFFGSIVWMFYALCRYSLAVPACTLEKLPIRHSIVRSKFLTNGAKGSILGIILLTGLMSFILTYVLQLPALLMSNAVIMTGKTHLSLAATVWIYIADFLGGALAGPIATIALALVYYDQRVRKEAFDLQLMMEAVGQQKPQAQPAVAAQV